MHFHFSTSSAISAVIYDKISVENSHYAMFFKFSSPKLNLHFESLPDFTPTLKQHKL